MAIILAEPPFISSSEIAISLGVNNLHRYGADAGWFGRFSFSSMVNCISAWSTFIVITCTLYLCNEVILPAISLILMLILFCLSGYKNTHNQLIYMGKIIYSNLVLVWYLNCLRFFHVWLRSMVADG